MGDLALQWQATEGAADLALADDDLLSEEGLRTAVLLSLFLDRRADDEDSLPASDGDRKGWWGDEFTETPNDRIGSRLWLLDRSKRLADVVPLTEQYAKESLEWMVEDLVAERVDVAASTDGDRLILVVTVHRPKGRDPAEFRFAHAWTGEEANAV